MPAYGDAQLDTLIEEALLISPTLASAQARIEKARALAQGAGAELWPTPTGICEHSSTLTAQRVANGVENHSAAAQADASTASTREQLVALDESISLTRSRLEILLGAGPDRGLLINRPDIHTLAVFAFPADLQANLMGRRPDIIAARLRAESTMTRLQHRVSQRAAQMWVNHHPVYGCLRSSVW